jgi:TatD DNase family protein
VLIDCHAHLADAAFDRDRAEVLERARAAGVGAILVVGEDLEDDRRVEALAAVPGAPRILPCAGLHPDRWAESREAPDERAIAELEQYCRGRRASIAAIGEVGLDRFWVKTEERRRDQERLLERIAALAIELDLPLNVHSRSAGERTIDLLVAAGARRVLLHAFDGRSGQARRAAELGWVLSVPPSVVRSEQKQKLVRRVPLEALALESDAPVLGPTREARNEPANVATARDEIARLQGVSPDRVEEATTAAALALFRIR